ncbi:MAG: hypothetical protein U9N33_11710 [Campylobacterota bacterium]|nr:hypothetical protein [Campylobacterota bacterium]
MKIADSGIPKRYNKFKSIEDSEFNKILEIAENHRYDKSYKKLEYELYTGFSATILKDTRNHKEKAIVFDLNGDFICDKIGT